MNNIEETIINIIKSILDTSDDIKKDGVIRDLGINSIVFIRIGTCFHYTKIFWVQASVNLYEILILLRFISINTSAE